MVPVPVLRWRLVNQSAYCRRLHQYSRESAELGHFAPARELRHLQLGFDPSPVESSRAIVVIVGNIPTGAVTPSRWKATDTCDIRIAVAISHFQLHQCSILQSETPLECASRPSDANPHATIFDSENPTKNPTYQSDTTGRIRHHRTSFLANPDDSDATGPFRPFAATS